MVDCTLKYLAIIPARGGSKGVPGKNILPCGGRPLIEWSIQQALVCESIDRVIVSTDSVEISDIARSCGAEVPFMRPAELSKDETPTEPVLIHALGELAAAGYTPDAVMLLQATSPIRRPGRLQEAIDKFEAEDADSLMSVSSTNPFLWQGSVSPKPLYDPANRPRRQDVPDEQKIFRENGSIYITRAQLLLDKGNRLGGNMVLFEMDEDESPDIDTQSDFIIVDALLRKVLPLTSDSISLDDIDAIVFDFDGVLTDNRVITAADGTESVRCNRSDGLGFDMMHDLGIPALILSKERNPVVTARANKLNVPVLQNVGDKAQALSAFCAEKGFDPKRIIFVGNDVNDLPAMNTVGYPIAVADAHPAVKKAARYVLNQPGGGTVAREILEEIICISAADWVLKKTKQEQVSQV